MYRMGILAALRSKLKKGKKVQLIKIEQSDGYFWWEILATLPCIIHTAT